MLGRLPGGPEGDEVGQLPELVQALPAAAPPALQVMDVEAGGSALDIAEGELIVLDEAAHEVNVEHPVAEDDADGVVA